MSSNSSNVILGLNADYINKNASVHESSVALLKNGKIVAAIAEERLSRKKGDGRYPHLAIDEVLKISGTRMEEVDRVVISNLHPTQGSYEYLKSIFGAFLDTGVFLGKQVKEFSWYWIYNKFKTPQKINFEYKGKKYPIEVEFSNHHTGHAASAYYASPFDDALIVTLDGGGDGLDGTVFYGQGTKMHKLIKVPHYQSPGTMYSAITNDLGFRRLRHEGKITGLAAFGNPDYKKLELDNLITYNPRKHRFISKEIVKHHRDLRDKSTYFFPLIEKYGKEDLAACAQAIFETATIDFVKDAYNQARNAGFEPKNICLAGGCFTNVKLNQHIIETGLFKNIFIYPAMGDEGLAAGAALYSYYTNNKVDNKKASVIDNVYLGGEFTDEQIENALKEFSLNYEKHQDIEVLLGKLLADGKIIGRYNGKMEYGPRSLGNRSIIGAPFDYKINDWLNNKLHRTEFMPFAPSVLEEYAADYFEGYKPEQTAADFMTITYNVKKGMKEKIPAVVHVDNTARPQIVRKYINPSYHKIISEFHKHTGCAVVLNTSFNIHEEPIVYTPQDAIRGFLDSQLDYLAIGNYLVEYNRK
jgi:carbamoyltransferase